MDDLGHITLLRSFFGPESRLWNETRRFHRAEAWIDLIAQAAWRDHYVQIGNRSILLRRGEVCHSIRTLCRRWRWGNASVVRFIDAQKSERALEQRTERGISILIVVNYDHYQKFLSSTERDEERKQERERNASGTRAEQTETGKQGNNTPPTPPKKAEPDDCGGGIFDALTAKFPALARRGITREALRSACADRNGETARFVAAVALCAGDNACRFPLRAAEARLTGGGVDALTVKTVERILAGESAVQPRPAPMSDAERAEEDARRAREAQECRERIAAALRERNAHENGATGI